MLSERKSSDEEGNVAACLVEFSDHAILRKRFNRDECGQYCSPSTIWDILILDDPENPTTETERVGE
jgi:hypothetical protein